MFNNRNNNNNQQKKEPIGCYFCTNNLKEVDYKNADVLKKYISGYMRILPRKRTELCAAHQRKMTSAAKLARIMALLPFTNR